jgi:hypothetical protein
MVRQICGRVYASTPAAGLVHGDDRRRADQRDRAELSLLTPEEIARVHFENAAELRRVREEREFLGHFRARQPQGAEQCEVLPHREPPNWGVMPEIDRSSRNEEGLAGVLPGRD